MQLNPLEKLVLPEITELLRARDLITLRSAPETLLPSRRVFRGFA